MSQIYLQRRSTTNENIFTELNAERLLATAFGVDVCLENSNCNPMLHSIDCDLANRDRRLVFTLRAGTVFIDLRGKPQRNLPRS